MIDSAVISYKAYIRFNTKPKANEACALGSTLLLYIAEAMQALSLILYGCCCIARQPSYLRGKFSVCGELLQLFEQGIIELVLVKLEQLLHEAGVSQLLLSLFPSGSLLEDCHDSRQRQLHQRRWLGICLYAPVPSATDTILNRLGNS